MSAAATVLSQRPAAPVWRHFLALCGIPRPSGHEEGVRRYLEALARRHGWESARDAAGNLVLRVPGRGRLAGAPPLILQSHMDMVAEKNADTVHDFLVDPIRPVVRDGWLMASGTTLGADNGLGLALALAAAEEDRQPDRLPLELLCTVDEERGLQGALELDPVLLRGRRLLNLDAGDRGEFTIGCAGAVHMDLSAPLSESFRPAWRLTLRGLAGGHSGIDIDKGRVNAIRAVAELLADLHRAQPALQVGALHGGDKVNAIPRECELSLAGIDQPALAAAAAQAQTLLRRCEPAAVFSVVPAAPSAVAALPWTVLDFLGAVPLGVLGMDPGYPNLVRTSNNIGVVRCAGDRVCVGLFGRSSAPAELATLKDQVRGLAAACGCALAFSGESPAWTPNPESPLLQRGVRLWTELFGQAPAVGAIHAGLEAGIIGAKLDSRDMLACGPTLKDLHSPHERAEIASVDDLYRFLVVMVS